MPSRQLSECWDSHAMTLGFSNFSCRPRHEETVGMFIPMRRMIAEAAPDSAFILCCQAVGNAFLTSKVATVEARSRRAAAYGRALTATNAALQDSTVQLHNQTLAAVWLLGIYEVSHQDRQVGDEPAADQLRLVDRVACWGFSAGRVFAPESWSGLVDGTYPGDGHPLACSGHYPVEGSGRACHVLARLQHCRKCPCFK
jgi:hypothetical protein